MLYCHGGLHLCCFLLPQTADVSDVVSSAPVTSRAAVAMKSSHPVCEGDEWCMCD